MTDNDLNEQVNVTVDDASVITVPIDATLQNSNEAADAKAVGDALALKADKSELQAAVKVNNQPADAQGLILIDGRHIPVSDQDTETLANAVTDLKGKTAADIPMSSESDAKTIAEVVNANSEAIEGMEEMTGATMPIESGSQTTVKAAIEARVKTVNRKAPDADGDVDLSVVPLAENLQSDKMESVEGSFIIRTTGGNASVSDGKAYPLHLFGSADHAGYVAEQLNMTVIPITRTEPDEPITATIDRDTFVAYVDESSTINLYYTTEWSADPELYGITVIGTPVAGDQITVVYVKEVRGTITVANPARLVGTGWNLFDYNNGYARVVKYSTEYGYKIGGSYASLQFSATLTGERSSITPGVDGLFNVPSDGYVFVTGGNNTDTYILTTWSDWMEGPSSGYWEPYRESGIDLSAVMTTYFPNGLLAVGTTRDEINLSAKRSISRIERMAYSEENRAAAAASGRSYDFDQNYIYIVRESAVISAITIDTTYNVSEHGLEWFTETTLPVISEILYGKNLRDKLERDVVTISAQTLTEEEKAQVRTNIGAMSQADGDKKLVAPTTAGTAGQLLHLKADGGTEWTTQGTPTDAQVGTAVSAWLTAHPEATTTVQDGAISRAKLNDDLKAKTDAVSDLKSALNIITGNAPVEYIKGKYISTNGSAGTTVNTTLQTEPTFECAIVPCSQGDIFTVAGQGGSYPQLWCFTDSSYKITRNSGFNVTETGKVLTVQASEAYLILNNKDFSKQTVKGIKLQNRVSDIESTYFRPLSTPSGTTALSALRGCGSYSITNDIWQNITDKPTGSPANSVSTLINITNALNNNHIIQFLLCGTGETYRRYINTSGEVYQNWTEIDLLELKNNIQYTFMSRHPAGNETTLASMRSPGVYNLDATLVQNITDLPDGLPVATYTLINYPNSFAASNIIQKLVTLDMIEYTRILNSNGTLYKGWKKANDASDVLFGKKLVTAGDSYTAANFGSDSPYTLKNYGYYVAQRHSMAFVNAGISGSIMALDKTYVADPDHVDINYHNPFSYQRYLNIPNDADYLTIWFGINDAPNTNLGTIDDDTNETFYGAWNVVLRYYLTNRPFLKIGLVVTVGATDEYRQAVREIAQKWGYPYLDFVNNVQIPAFFDRNGMSAEAQGLRRAAFGYNDYAAHPSPQWHIYASTIFENFLKSL